MIPSPTALNPAWPALRALVLALTLVCNGCMPTPEADTPPAVKPGGASDTETLTAETLSGSVRDGSAAPAAHVALKLIPEDYDPRHPDTASIRRTISDDTGGFAFTKVDTTRTYNLIAGDAPAKKWALASGIRPDGTPRALSLSLAKVFLFSMHSETYSRADSGIAFFPGTDILAHCDGAKASKVDSVPAEALRFIVESRAGWQHDTTLAAAADTTRVSAGKSRLILIP
jgi:hypothetical protein